MKEIEIDAKDPDIKRTNLRWWDIDSVFLEQIESDGRKNGPLIFQRESIPDLITALKKFLGEVSMDQAAE